MSKVTRAITNRADDSIASPRRDILYVGLLASVASVLAFAHYFFHHEILLYGDATAHISIARRVFDSRTPGFSQLGTVWLPLPHILMIPFILPIRLWQLGIGGSIPSMIAYIAGTLGVFRLVRGALPWTGTARIAAWCATLVYALNPNLLYMQSTAMTESLYLALFVWATVYFSEFVQASRATDPDCRKRRSRSLRRCGWMLLAAMLTRYDGWFAAAAFAPAALAVFWNWTGGRTSLWRSPLRPAVVRFLVILAAAPVFWFSYNAIFWHNPLEFANGPYSAQAYADRTENHGWRHPGWHAPVTGTMYFLKSAKLNLAGGLPAHETPTAHASLWRLQNAWIPLAFLGTVLLLVLLRSLWPLLLLWVPVPFYVVSVAWGGATIFVKDWWPYSHYNARYGLQLLPALAVFGALTVYLAAQSPWRRKAVGLAALVLFGLLAGASYLTAWRATPVCVREAHENNVTRIPFDQQLAAELARMRPGATVLMWTARHAAALEFAGFPLRRTINETNEYGWPDALDNPGSRTDYVVAFETSEDPVWRAVQDHQNSLQLTSIVSGLNEPRAFVYEPKRAGEGTVVPPAAPVPAAAAVPKSEPAKAEDPKDDDNTARASSDKKHTRGRKHVRRQRHQASHARQSRRSHRRR